MKLRVIIHRQTGKEPDTGKLRAYVVQAYIRGDGQPGELRGPNILQGRIFKLVDSAIQRCDDVIQHEYKLVEVPEIEYVVEDGAK